MCSLYTLENSEPCMKEKCGNVENFTMHLIYSQGFSHRIIEHIAEDYNNITYMLNLKKPNLYRQRMVVTKGWEIGTGRKLTIWYIFPISQVSSRSPGNHLSSKSLHSEQLEIAFISPTENTRPEFYF